MDDKLVPIVETDETFTVKPSVTDRLIKRVTGQTKQSFTDYVIKDVIIPAAKDFALDFVEGLLYGKTGGPANKYRRFGGYSTNRTTYTAFFGSGTSKKFGAPSNSKAYPGYDDNVNAEDIIDSENYAAVAFKNRGKAEEVLINLRDRVAAIGYATIGDFDDLAHRKGEFVDYNYGWYNLDEAHVSRIGGGGYVIRFPKPVAIR